MRSQTKLDGYASAAFGRHQRMEAWVCQDADNAVAMSEEYECLPVMIDGEMVVACADGPPQPREPLAPLRVATSSTDKDAALFNRLVARLPHIKLPSVKKLFKRRASEEAK